MRWSVAVQPVGGSAGRRILYLLKSFLVIEALLVLGLWLFQKALRGRWASSLPSSAIAVVLLMPAVGLFCQNIMIYDAFLFVAMAVNARSKERLAATLALILPLTPVLNYPMVVRGAYLFEFSALHAICAGALLGHFLTKNRLRRSGLDFDVAIVAIVAVLAFINGRDSSLLDVFRNGVVQAIILVGPYLLISRASVDRASVERILVCLICGAFLTAVTGIFQAGRHWIVYQAIYEALHVPVPLQSWTTALRGGFLRTGGAMLDYSAAGLFLATAMSVALAMSRVFTRPGLIGLFVALGGGLLATQSRGGWIAAGVGLGLTLLYQRQYALTAATAAAAGIVIAFRFRSPLTDAASNEGSTADYRRQLASLGMDQVRAHPLLGQPPKALINNLAELTQGQHIVDFVNGHLFIAMTAGVPLFLIWAAAWLMPIVRTWRSRPKKPDVASLTGIPAALVVSPMVALLFTSLVDRNLVWPAIGLAVASACFAPEAMAVRAKPRAVRKRLVAALPQAA